MNCGVGGDYLILRASGCKLKHCHKKHLLRSNPQVCRRLKYQKIQNLDQMININVHHECVSGFKSDLHWVVTWQLIPG